MWQLIVGSFITLIFLKFMFGDSFDRLMLEIIDLFDVLFKLSVILFVIWLITLPIGIS